MSPLLSVVIPCLDDPAIVNTVASIRETAGDIVEIIIVDDCSTLNGGQFSNWCQGVNNVKVVHNRNRCGSGPSRHIGALYAEGKWLLHTDSHMRFYDGWYKSFQEGQYNQPMDTAVFCGSMVALEPDGQERGTYHGATLNVLGPDPSNDKQQVFEANWNKTEPDDGAEIACCMGACYFVPREWYLALSPHRFLRSWGKEEEALSVKTWLAGGRVRLLKSVKIGHIFRDQKTRLPYEIPPVHLLYNKLFCIWTLTPPELRDRLLSVLSKTEPHFRQAMALIEQDGHIIATEIATMPREVAFSDYCQKFGIPLPS